MAMNADMKISLKGGSSNTCLRNFSQLRFYVYKLSLVEVDCSVDDLKND